jgi:calcium-translocating P-type ATPase
VTEHPDDWHARPAEEALARLAVPAHGLTGEEAKRRLAEHGPNELPEAERRHPLFRFLAQFDNALIYFLLAAALAALALRHYVDAAVIFAVVLVNALVGFLQEGKAEKALAAMRRMLAPRASVLRGGARASVPVRELVPGDVVVLEAGDRVPADLRLLRARGLLIDEALLTGESVAAQKKDAPAHPEAQLGDRHSMAYSGTLVAAGQAHGVVVATGRRTQIGRISELLEEVEPLTTPLLRQINRFGRAFTGYALGGAAALFAFAVLVRDYPWAQALMAVVALSVGVIPEGLPAVITITLAIGVQRMAARHAIIRRLPAVETLGATSVICSDKTGTLTKNEMSARRIVAAGEAALLRCAVLCNDAHLVRRGAQVAIEGDPMEGALLLAAARAGLDPATLRREWPRLDEIPFDAAHRFMASLHRESAGEAVLYVKGAPEQVLAMSALQEGAAGEAPIDHAHWGARIAEAAAQGERVLGFAVRHLGAGHERLDFDDVSSLVFLGIVGFMDPPREEALAAIAECRSAGIAVKMITGDHAATASAIARELRLAPDPSTITGAQIDRMSDADLAGAVHAASVFARTSPEHKLRIVRALQAGGAVVAMTGDGVNDAPALKQADVGVAMGIKGTEAAKEAAEMVLADDNFASIVNAVHEGRTVYDNIRKVIAWTLPTNGGEVLTVLVAILAGFTLPMTAVQILWVNLVTSVTLGLALAFEPAEPGVMARPPRDPAAPLLSRFLLWRVALVSGLFFAASLAIFFYALERGRGLETARTLVVNTVVTLEIFYLFNVRYLHRTSFTLRGVLGTPAVLAAVGAITAAQFAFTYAPFMNAWFDTRPVALADGILVVLAGVALLVLLEGEKALLRKLGVAVR